MSKEIISARLAVCTMVLFMFGSSALISINTDVGQDSWISFLLALMLALPVTLVYARIIKLFPENDVFEIIEILFGRILGCVLNVLITWYAIHLAALVIRNFSEFIKNCVMLETPEIMIIIVMILTIVYMIKSGIEVMGRWSLVMIYVVISVVVITAIFSINKMNIDNIKPFLEHSLPAIALNSFGYFSFPFAETVLFLCLAGSFNKKESPYKMYIYSTVFAAMILLTIVIRNILLLGPKMSSTAVFPSFEAVSIVDVGGFLARIEGSIAINLILAGIVKITVCLVAASKGVALIFRLPNYKSITFPVAVFAVAMSVILFSNTTEMLTFQAVYPFYAIPFQILIPLLVWIVGEVKVRKSKSGLAKESS